MRRAPERRDESIARVLLFAMAWPALGLAAGDRFGPEDLARLADVTEPEFSADGAWVAYTVTTANLQTDEAVSDLWRVRYDGGAPQQLTNTADASEWRAQWSPDGRTIAFLADRGGDDATTQVWVMPSAGGEARKLTDFPAGVEDFAWSPDGKRFAVIARDAGASRRAAQAQARAAHRHRALPVQGGHHRLPGRAAPAPVPLHARGRQGRVAHAGRA